MLDPSTRIPGIGIGVSSLGTWAQVQVLGLASMDLGLGAEDPGMSTKVLSQGAGNPGMSVRVPMPKNRYSVIF